MIHAAHMSLHVEQRVDGRWLHTAPIAGSPFNVQHTTRHIPLVWVLGGPRRSARRFWTGIYGDNQVNLRMISVPPAVAGHRGMPSDASAQTSAAHAAYVRESQPGYPSEVWGTWLMLDELLRFRRRHRSFCHRTRLWSFWSDLRRLAMCRVHEDCRDSPGLGRACRALKHDDVRIVGWFGAKPTM